MVGREEEADSILRNAIEDGLALVDEGDQRPGVLFDVANAYAALGDTDGAMDTLERAYVGGFRMFTFLPWFEVVLEPMKNHRRYQAWSDLMSAEIERMAARLDVDGIESQFLKEYERN